MTGIDHSGIPHFQESTRIHPAIPGDRLPSALYSSALDYLVIACVDIVFTHKTQVLLAKRDRPPRASWWIIGGRMTAGEAPLEAAQRKVHEEAHLSNIDPSRFHLVGVYSTCFATRHQPPQQHGLHSLNITYQLELTAAEQAQIVLSPEEYSTSRWVDRQQVSTLLEAHDILDNALLKVIHDLGSGIN